MLWKGRFTVIAPMGWHPPPLYFFNRIASIADVTSSAASCCTKFCPAEGSRNREAGVQIPEAERCHPGLAASPVR